MNNNPKLRSVVIDAREYSLIKTLREVHYGEARVEMRGGLPARVIQVEKSIILESDFDGDVT